MPASWSFKPIRALIVLALATAPALAEDSWTHYANAPFAYEIDIPPGYENFADSADGNGAIFMLSDQLQELTVWGEKLGKKSDGFAAESAALAHKDEAGGWTITYQAATPEWTTWSGTRNDMVVYQRTILLCDRQSFASFRAIYPAKALSRMDKVIEGLVRSFVPMGC